MSKTKEGKVLCINPKKKKRKYIWVNEEIANIPEMLKARGLELAK